MVLSKKNILYYGKRYDTIPKTIEFWFTMEQNLGTMGKKHYFTIVDTY